MTGGRITLDAGWHEKTECLYSWGRLILLRDEVEAGWLLLWHPRSFNSVRIPPDASSAGPPDALMDIMLPSLWLQHGSFLTPLNHPSSIPAVTTAGCRGLLCRLCLRHEEIIVQKGRRRQRLCVTTGGCDTEPLTTTSKAKTAQATSKITVAVVRHEKGRKVYIKTQQVISQRATNLSFTQVNKTRRRVERFFHIFIQEHDFLMTVFVTLPVGTVRTQWLRVRTRVKGDRLTLLL